MVDRRKLLRELQFIGNALGERNETLTRIAQQHMETYQILLKNPGIDPFALKKKEKSRIIPYDDVWDTIDEMGYDEMLTGCEVVTRLIRKHQPTSSNIPLGFLTGGSSYYSRIQYTREE